jgi:hypothetical protein
MEATMTSHCRRCLLHEFNEEIATMHKRDTSCHLMMHIGVFYGSFNM